MKGSTGVLPFIFDEIASNMKGSTPVLPFIFDFLLNKSGPCLQCKHICLYLYMPICQAMTIQATETYGDNINNI